MSYFLSIYDENLDDPHNQYLGDAMFYFAEFEEFEECKEFILKQLAAGVILDNVNVVQGSKVILKLDLKQV